MSVAWMALILWPLICNVLYRKIPLPTALCVTILGGYLLLPNGVSSDLPLLPPLDKHSIPTFTALLLTASALRQRKAGVLGPEGWLPRSPVTLGLLAMLVLGTFGTLLTNGETLVYGPNVIPGLRPYDAFSMLLGVFVVILPVFLGRRILASPEGQRTLIVALAVSGVIYCVPALYEVRMSPQLHIKVYGYFPHDFMQAFRGGGFRPNVFLNHGLELAMFLGIALVAAAGLYRTADKSSRAKWLMATGFIFGTLVLAKSLGALMVMLLVLPVVLFLKQRIQLLVAVCIAAMVITYPMLRGADLVPTAWILSKAEAINPDRAASLEFRFRNEDQLLEKARQKPVFGWGAWSRNRVFDSNGTDISVTDGAWIVQFGVGGWVRYLAIFGLLCWPVIGLLFIRRDKVDPLCIVLALALAAKLLDLIPNGANPPILWLIVGSLLGRLEMRMSAGAPELQAGDTPIQKLGYTRRAAVQPKGEHPADKPRYARTFPDKTEKPKKSGPARSHMSYHRSKPTPR